METAFKLSKVTQLVNGGGGIQTQYSGNKPKDLMLFNTASYVTRHVQ